MSSSSYIWKSCLPQLCTSVTHFMSLNWREGFPMVPLCHVSETKAVTNFVHCSITCLLHLSSMSPPACSTIPKEQSCLLFITEDWGGKFLTSNDSSVAFFSSRILHIYPFWEPWGSLSSPGCTLGRSCELHWKEADTFSNFVQLIESIV